MNYMKYRYITYDEYVKLDKEDAKTVFYKPDGEYIGSFAKVKKADIDEPVYTEDPYGITILVVPKTWNIIAQAVEHYKAGYYYRVYKINEKEVEE